MMIIEGWNIEEFFLRILSKDDFFNHNREGALKKLNSQDPDYQSVNELVFNETVKLIEESPQILIDLVRDSFIDTKALTTTLANKDVLKKKEKNISDKMKSISIFYELSSFFRLGSYLLNGRKAPIHSLKNPQKIFKAFKEIGIDFNTDKIRLIRNAASHKFSIRDKWLVDEGNKDIIEVNEIDKIYLKLKKVFNWYMNYIFFHSYYIPKFGLLLLHTAYHEITENRQEYNDYYKGVKLVAPDIFNKRKKKPPPKNKGLIRRLSEYMKDKITIRGTIQIRLSKNKYHNKPIYRQNLKTVETHLERQVNICSQHLDNINVKLTNPKDNERILKTIELLNKKKVKWISRIRHDRIKT